MHSYYNYLGSKARTCNRKFKCNFCVCVYKLASRRCGWCRMWGSDSLVDMLHSGRRESELTWSPRYLLPSGRGHNCAIEMRDRDLEASTGSSHTLSSYRGYTVDIAYALWVVEQVAQSDVMRIDTCHYNGRRKIDRGIDIQPQESRQRLNQV
jgi:hypothetical protein